MTRATSANEVTIVENRHAGNHNLLVMYFEVCSGWGRCWEMTLFLSLGRNSGCQQSSTKGATPIGTIEAELFPADC
eukprot:scaffold4124_cov267-Chaetoceros_neogracile.AAC.4